MPPPWYCNVGCAGRGKSSAAGARKHQWSQIVMHWRPGAFLDRSSSQAWYSVLEVMTVWLSGVVVMTV